MKISKEYTANLANIILNHYKEKGESLRELWDRHYQSLAGDSSVRDIDMRMRWDLFHAINFASGDSIFSRELYGRGFNDNHIDTMLKNAVTLLQLPVYKRIGDKN